MGTIKGNTLDNSLLELAAGVKIASTLITGGSKLSSYDTISYSNNYSLITLNHVILTYLYTGNGIFQTAIQQPIQDAVSKGIEIHAPELSSDEIEDLKMWLNSPFEGDLENATPLETIMDAFTWKRLYGGGGIVINNGENPEEPLNKEAFNFYNNQIEMYDVDRWQVTDYNFVRNNLNYTFDTDFFHFNGVRVHKTRLLKTKGKKAPYYVRNNLRGWGLSEGERMIRDLNLYFKTQDVLYEIIDESKIDVYKIKDFASKLLQKGGVNKIQTRIMLANELKSYVNALVLDTQEEYEQKTLSFNGLAEVMKENRMGVAAALRMPLTKLFGLSASGFNTGESDLENYNMTVESDVRTPMSPIIVEILKIGCAKLFNFIPDVIRVSYPSLRVLSSLEEEDLKTSQQNRALFMYDRGLITSEEFMKIGKTEGWVSIDTQAEIGLLGKFPTPPNQGELVQSLKTDKVNNRKGVRNVNA